ncbi:MAG: HNH endonuclease [Syntrophaceae bacterium]|nr:HNH endonuclease [Pseudomonadota bacterium]MBU4287336.1 HNH endonuclease [Pseudomonadota bacterium]MBU4403912.1 HNH endonuclease [Actinomycetota bacterium]MCG2740419.1 HNH endonuclease [Syntrophaceae bacterium]
MTRRRGSDEKGRKFTEERVDEVWEKGKKIQGKDPNLYRRDSAGNEIYKPSHGKNTEVGWEVDHKKPVDKGGSDNLRNLQPLQTEENKEKGTKYPW